MALQVELNEFSGVEVSSFCVFFFTRSHAQTFLWKYHPYDRKTLPYYCSRQVYIQSPIQKIIRGKKQQRKGRMRCGGYEKCDAVVGYLLIGSTFPFPTRSALFSFFLLLFFVVVNSVIGFSGNVWFVCSFLFM